MENFAEVSKLNVGAAIIVKGTLVATPEAKQPFETLSHIAGVHHVAMTVARGLKKAGGPIDLALSSGAAAGHDLGKFGCKPNERVPYLHYYYTNPVSYTHLPV